MLLPFHKLQKIETLVENKSVYTANFAELYIYETFQKAEKVYLQFDFPVITSMIQGKKHMHMLDQPSFDFLPGETVTLPTSEKMIIDFPDAKLDEPTRCLALGIDIEKIKNATYHYRELIEIESDELPILDMNIKPKHLTNNLQLQQLINKLMLTFMNDHKVKDALVDVMINELIIRLLQTKAKDIILKEGAYYQNNNRMSFVIQYIEEHLNENLSVETLANKAYMSTSSFYRKFKSYFGETPVDYVNKKRLELAKTLIKSSSQNINDICATCGFNSSAYFSRIFKKNVGLSPNQFRKTHSKS
ncbi:MAG: AraC family transcriptional regulator [Psychroflexus salarius]